MSSEFQSLFSLARNKLQYVVGGHVKESCSLHRWVLLKNSIVRSHTSIPNAADAKGEADTEPAYTHDDDVLEEEENDTFMFPDPRTIHDAETSSNDESQWLDSLLENLEDDDDEDHPSAFRIPATDDEEPLSPMYSPMSSSDDLVDQTDFYPYIIPYPPLHPAVNPAWYELEASTDSIDPLSATPALYDNPLPYYGVDDLEDESVPDAIDDLSDDESDAFLTPSSGSTASISPPSSLPISLPRERPRPPSLAHPQVYIETDEPSYYSFEVDPLPFPQQPTTSPPRASVFRHAYAGSC
ncbi:hypothetical protein BC835DRAFT_517548 [Cytidiella melzeri]|nr:hypothetical protein BC835DRAFT_517548 [Cytidiella melzeri]